MTPARQDDIIFSKIYSVSQGFIFDDRIREVSRASFRLEAIGLSCRGQ
jgi:hypothetical protein